MTASSPPLVASPGGAPAQLSGDDAATYAHWFACLAEPVRVRLLHAVATATGPVSVGRLAELTGISQATCSHHLRKLADTGFLVLRREGTSTRVSVNPACCVGLPHAADAVMGAARTPSVLPRRRSRRRHRARHGAERLGRRPAHLRRGHRDRRRHLRHRGPRRRHPRRHLVPRPPVGGRDRRPRSSGGPRPARPRPDPSTPASPRPRCTSTKATEARASAAP